MSQTPSAEALRIFYSYAPVPEDQALLAELEKHLATLRSQGLIEDWSRGSISAGADWQHEIDANLDKASLVLFLVSPDFIASDDCSIEMRRAMELHDNHQACVIPILLRPVSYEGALFSKLHPLPTDRRAITCWPDQDAAFVNVVNGIKKVIENLHRQPPVDLPPPSIPQGKPSRRGILIGGAVALGSLIGGAITIYELFQHQLEPPTGFTVTRTTLKSGQTMQPGQVLVNADIPLTIQGTCTSQGAGLVWVVLEDSIEQYYLQNPRVRFNDDNRTWTATHIIPLSGTTKIDFVVVTPDGNGWFQQKVSNNEFGRTPLPQGSLILRSVTISINTSQITSST